MLAAGTTRPVVMEFVIHRLDPGQRTVYSAYMAEGEVVWSISCTHLHQSVEAAQKCFPKLRREWEVWGALPRVPVGFPYKDGVVEMRRGSHSRRMIPLDPSVYRVVAS
jgi:hypothetical protein